MTHNNAKAMPINDTDYSCHITAIKLVLTNHMGFISHHQLLIASRVDTQTYTHIDICTETILRNQALAEMIGMYIKLIIVHVFM